MGWSDSTKKSEEDTSSLRLRDVERGMPRLIVKLSVQVSAINHKTSPPLRNEGGVKRCDSTEQTPLAPYEGNLSLSRQDERRIELGVPFETDINHKASPPHGVKGGFSRVRVYEQSNPESLWRQL